MKYLLDEKFILRGWQRLPHTLVDTSTGNLIFLTSEEFDFLLKCDGKYLFDIENNEHKRFISTFAQKKIINLESGKLKNIQKYKYYENAYIPNIHWAITENCNLQCKHCFMSARNWGTENLSTEDCYKIVDKLVNIGTFKLSLTGGEPLIRKDLFELISYIVNNNIIITDIYTNGSLISEVFIQNLKALNINPIFHVSFDGLLYHDWMRNNKYVSNATYNGVKLLRNNNYNVHISYSLCKENRNNLIESFDEISTWNVQFLKVGFINPIGRWSISYNESLTTKEIYDCFLEIIPIIIEKKYPMTINLGGFIEIAANAANYSFPLIKKKIQLNDLIQYPMCVTMRNNLYIDPKGKLRLCEMLIEFDNEKLPDILTDDLGKHMDINSDFMKLLCKPLGEMLEENNTCKTCDFLENCHMGCRANAYNFNGNYKSPDSFRCVFFKNNYINKITKVINRSL